MNTQLAVFDENGHATVAGIASYHDANAHPWRCRIFGHQWSECLGPPNEYNPRIVVKCRRGCWGKWFVVGQHHFGSYDAPVVRRS